MASRYKFNGEEIKAIQQARKENKDKRVEAGLKALELRAKEQKAEEVAAATGFHPAYVTQLVAKYPEDRSRKTENLCSGIPRRISVRNGSCVWM